MSDLPNDRLREIANPAYVPCCTYDEQAAMARELLAARQRLAVLERVREAAGWVVANAVPLVGRDDERMVYLPVLDKLCAALDAAKEAK